MSDFFYWSGFVAWICGGIVGIFLALDWAIDRMIDSFKLKKEFLSFVWSKLKAKGAPGSDANG